jgi:hypothetical protein
MHGKPGVYKPLRFLCVLPCEGLNLNLLSIFAVFMFVGGLGIRCLLTAYS